VAENRPATFQVSIVHDTVLAEETRKLFARYGLPVSVTVGAADFDFNSFLQVIATFVIAGPVAAFLGAFASEGGKDAYRRLKEFLHDQRATSDGSRAFQLVMLSDPTTKVRVLLSDELSDEALQALFQLQLQTFEGRADIVAAWDARARQWRPQKYPTMRSDLFGWYANSPVSDSATSWHCTRDPDSSPIMTLCKQRLDRAVFRPRIGANPCERCGMVDWVSRGGVPPASWDSERADFTVESE
jgi:hypothetical protein